MPTNIFDLPIIDFNEYSTDFTWDNILHFPVPTIQYVNNRVGINMVEVTGSQQQASITLLSISRTVKGKLFRFLDQNSIEYREFILSRDKGMIYQALEITLEFVNALVNTGDYMDFFRNQNKGVYIEALENIIHTSDLRFRTTAIVPRSLVRNGY